MSRETVCTRAARRVVSMTVLTEASFHPTADPASQTRGPAGPIKRRVLTLPHVPHRSTPMVAQALTGCAAKGPETLSEGSREAVP